MIHRLRVSLMVGVTLLALSLLSAAAQAGSVSAADAAAAAASGERLLIDLRSPDEWRETGVPADAAAITIHDPDGLPAFVEKVLALAGTRERPVAVICATGRRSGFAVRLLEEAGFTDVADVSEGMMGSGAGPGWLARGLSVEPCRVC